MALTPERWTTKSRQAVQAAESLARARAHQEVSQEHLLLAMLEQAEGTVEQVLLEAGVRPDAVAHALKAELDKRPQVGGDVRQQVSPSFMRALEKAEARMASLKDEFLSVEHLLLGILDEGSSPAARVLADAGLTPDKAARALAKVRGSQRVTRLTPVLQDPSYP